MIEEIKKDAKRRMSKSVEALKHEFSKLRTGRAHASLLDHIMVPYYGSEVPINQVASVAVSDARTLTVTPWEKKSVPDVEKAILNSDLGLNPVSAGEVIRVPLPPLTEERRNELIRVVRHIAEEGRVAIRNVRRHTKDHIESLEVSQDDIHRAEKELQVLTDTHTDRIDELLKHKEEELLEV